jgi:hypothetical protein
MEKEFISYEQALALKELGFNKPCFGVYDYVEMLHFGKIYFFSDIEEPSYLAPTYTQAFRWFREKYGLDYSINPFYYPETTKIRFRWDYFKFIYHEVPNRRKFESFGGGEATREEAELECLKKLIEIVKTKK